MTCLPSPKPRMFPRTTEGNASLMRTAQQWMTVYACAVSVVQEIGEDGEVWNRLSLARSVPFSKMWPEPRP